MLLAIDVGNTNIVLGVFEGATLIRSWRLQTLRERTSDELGLLVGGLFAHSRIERVQIRAIILGSVVPPLTPTIHAMSAWWKAWCGACATSSAATPYAWRPAASPTSSRPKRR